LITLSKFITVKLYLSVSAQKLTMKFELQARDAITVVKLMPIQETAVK